MTSTSHIRWELSEATIAPAKIFMLSQLGMLWSGQSPNFIRLCSVLCRNTASVWPLAKDKLREVAAAKRPRLGKHEAGGRVTRNCCY